MKNDSKTTNRQILKTFKINFPKSYVYFDAENVFGLSVFIVFKFFCDDQSSNNTYQAKLWLGRSFFRILFYKVSNVLCVQFWNQHTKIRQESVIGIVSSSLVCVITYQ